MKTRIEHKIHAIADVLFRDMKDGVRQRRRRVAGRTDRHYYLLQTLSASVSQFGERGNFRRLPRNVFRQINLRNRIIYILRRTYRRFGGFEIPEPRAVVGDRLFRCGEKLSGIAANIRDKQYSKRELRLPAWRTGHRQILLRRRRVCKPGIGGIGANR